MPITPLHKTWATSRLRVKGHTTSQHTCLRTGGREGPTAANTHTYVPGRMLSNAVWDKYVARQQYIRTSQLVM